MTPAAVADVSSQLRALSRMLADPARELAAYGPHRAGGRHPAATRRRLAELAQALRSVEVSAEAVGGAALTYAYAEAKLVHDEAALAVAAGAAGLGVHGARVTPLPGIRGLADPAEVARAATLRDVFTAQASVVAQRRREESATLQAALARHTHAVQVVADSLR